MDPSNLKTASTYVNNLLLARGLLRNGKPVDFAALLEPENGRVNHDKDSKRDPKARKGDNNGPQVVVQVINLVHDLILRRDVRLSQQTMRPDHIGTSFKEALPFNLRINTDVASFGSAIKTNSPPSHPPSPLSALHNSTNQAQSRASKPQIAIFAAK